MSETNPIPGVPPAAGHPVPPSRKQRAEQIIAEEAKWVFGVGLVPLAVVDAAAMTFVELRMIRRLAELYGQPYTENEARHLLVTAGTAVGATWLGRSVARSLFRAVPIVGWAASIASVSASVLPFHYLIGNRVVKAFEEGRSLSSALSFP